MMKKKLQFFNIALLLIAIFFLMNDSINALEIEKDSEFKVDDKKIILIDPGHGGMDGGAISKNGTVEKNINLSISLKLKKHLEKEGFKVVMTREEDKGLYSDSGKIRKKKNEDLENRCKMKEDSNCDMFISIHLNMFPQSKYYGSQVWYSSNPNSEKLAHIIQENFRGDLKDDSKRIEKAALNSYKILRCGKDIPSVIVECGFLSNPSDESKLKTEDYQQKIADSLLKSIKVYYNNSK
ncbi:N-acetylmuramoyl-L-alanine amidase [Clostridium pasteurianum]|nr:N-acetylmuramoyl-L-alanine amidase [Clostridium pasteurianum DSM 525 = ATCC 6013]AOZ81187.1 N-acetylmuramoyl-L-alanine amidase [Clostridium pasteurianum]OMH22110.1 N-acetylmuramoyl-L-alanine amidase [Clostridium pasteurianum]